MLIIIKFNSDIATGIHLFWTHVKNLLLNAINKTLHTMMLIWQRSKIVLSKQHRRLHGFLVSHARYSFSYSRTRAHLLTRRLISVVIAHVACMQIRECRVALIDRAMRRRSWEKMLLLHAHTFVQRLIAGLSEMLQICVPQRCFCGVSVQGQFLGVNGLDENWPVSG